eukprot:CAMPEP_0202863140 /NCGR_PEP_ID=MMETSP1391-20130828/3899_1 /ASSEMBLY_ACC=CAM_ASM_000867 /TAXON_ID=1034604 /ORGANISM="Chlamydomonas leiostraca, Strain SAG 11-49" /LENGTH=64 /DNA_ID=CAMNT_0049542741 /DNA_START=264 /DNA_END=458 /DNA_ORIENTATION=-
MARQGTTHVACNPTLDMVSRAGEHTRACETWDSGRRCPAHDTCISETQHVNLSKQLQHVWFQVQ